MTFESKISNPTDKQSLPLYESSLITNNTNGFSVEEMNSPIEKKSEGEKKVGADAKVKSQKEGPPTPAFTILKRDPSASQAKPPVPSVNVDVPPVKSLRSGVDVLNMLVQSSDATDDGNESSSVYSTPMANIISATSDGVAKTDKPKKIKKERDLKTKLNGIESSSEPYHDRKVETASHGNKNVGEFAHALKEMELRLSRKIEEESANRQTLEELSQLLDTSVRKNLANMIPVDFKSVVAASVAEVMEKEMKNVGSIH
jgi:hypothetical protein